MKINYFLYIEFILFYRFCNTFKSLCLWSKVWVIMSGSSLTDSPIYFPLCWRTRGGEHMMTKIFLFVWFLCVNHFCFQISWCIYSHITYYRKLIEDELPAAVLKSKYSGRTRSKCSLCHQDIIYHGVDSLWRHHMGTFSALLAICAGNSPGTGAFPSQMPVTRSFDVFFHLRLNIETPPRSLRSHCNAYN